MPSCDPAVLSPICRRIIELKPLTVLDIGIGFGKWGFLAREYAEIWGQNHYRERTVRVDGIEVFPAYITELHTKIYDRIYVGDALVVLPSLRQMYDLVIMADVIEHFSEADGVRVLDLIKGLALHAFITTPVNFSPQDAVFGNEYERHLSFWPPWKLAKWGKVAVFGTLCLLEIEGGLG